MAPRPERQPAVRKKLKGKDELNVNSFSFILALFSYYVVQKTFKNNLISCLGAKYSPNQHIKLLCAGKTKQNKKKTHLVPFTSNEL